MLTLSPQVLGKWLERCVAVGKTVLMPLVTLTKILRVMTNECVMCCRL